MSRTIRAAGAVVWRDGLVAVVHRPRYDDWSLPKGKLDPGETLPGCAVREVAEETGFSVVLDRFLVQAAYTAFGRPKTVDYYAATVVGGSFTPNEEVDELRWLPVSEAADLVTRPDDRQVLSAFSPPAGVVLLVRHAKAGKPAEWTGDDDLRPLTPAGREQVAGLRSLLRLWAPARVFSAPPLRCTDTVRALAADIGTSLVEEPLLSENGYWESPTAGMARLREIAAAGGTAVVCSQGDVIPDVIGRLHPGIATPCKKGSTWVLPVSPSTSDPHYLPPP
ncbi:NUDIX hydrolase [Saccharothrix violaceirubra]|uniref:8-oxo-dGTP diphosphatase n=1 Tax=Saccharothrix violaceirubra TaxID=413306 RepID=A0A7W7WUI8_9PSEU|nr:NUDIX hydrolase [Saccharothrix violaceirubra]MBB4963872.1 8-oxo-dGTP diphosphatase [Saccharothrix violaceirubra]